MYNLFNKCFNPSNDRGKNEKEEMSIFHFCNNTVDDISELQGFQIPKQNTSFFNSKLNSEYKKKKNNFQKENIKEIAHLNRYRENNFNSIWGIDSVDFPSYIYKYIFLNFSTSFINRDYKSEEENEIEETVEGERRNSISKKKEEKRLDNISYEDIHLINKIYKILKKQKFVLLHKANSTPHEKKRVIKNYKNGDAHICCDNIIAIADGVSSINNLGINVSNFSNNILKNCLNLHIYKCLNYDEFVKQNENIYKIYDLKYKPTEILRPLVCRSACSANFLGASTLLFAAIEKNKLHICNVGDSQMLIIRLKHPLLKKSFLEEIKIKVLTLDEIIYFFEEHENEQNRNLVHSSSYNVVEKKKSVKGLSTEFINSNSFNASENASGNRSKNKSKIRESVYPDKISEKKDEQMDIEVSKENIQLKESMSCTSSLSKKITKTVSHTESIKTMNDKEKESGNENESLQSKFTIFNDLTLKNEKVYYNSILKNIHLDENTRRKSTALIYIEKKLGRKKETCVKKYLESQNYKIGNLLFEIEKYTTTSEYENNKIDYSDSFLSSSTNASMYSEIEKDKIIAYEEKQKRLAKLQEVSIDQAGVRNMMNFFDMNATDIAKMRQGSCTYRNENCTERNSREYVDEINVTKTPRQKEKQEKRKNANMYNNYRFRNKNKEIDIFDVVYKSKIQQHYFNCPYQISSLPKKYNKKNNTYNNEKERCDINNVSNDHSDLYMNSYNSIFSKCLKNCKYSTVKIKDSDIIISGSDGVFDNLYDDDIMEIVFNSFYILKYNNFISLKEIWEFYKEYKDFAYSLKKKIRTYNEKTLKTNESSLFNKSDDIYSRVVDDKVLGNTSDSLMTQQSLKIVKEVIHGMSNQSSNHFSAPLHNKNATETDNINMQTQPSSAEITTRSIEGSVQRKDNDDKNLNENIDRNKKGDITTTMEEKQIKKNLINNLNEPKKFFPPINKAPMRKGKIILTGKNKAKNMANKNEKQLMNSPNDKDEVEREKTNEVIAKEKSGSDIMQVEKNTKKEADLTLNDFANAKIRNQVSGYQHIYGTVEEKSSFTNFKKEVENNSKLKLNLEALTRLSDKNIENKNYTGSSSRKNRENTNERNKKKKTDVIVTERSKMTESKENMISKKYKTCRKSFISEGVKSFIYKKLDDFKKEKSNISLSNVETGYEKKEKIGPSKSSNYASMSRMDTNKAWDNPYFINGKSVLLTMTTKSECENENKNHSNLYNEKSLCYENPINQVPKTECKIGKNKLIVEKKLSNQDFFYEPSDFILFDNKNKIYINLKKACDDILKLSTILANQKFDAALIKKKIRKHNKKCEKERMTKGYENGDMDKNERNKEKENDRLKEENKKKNGEENFVKDIKEKKEHIFDKINYDNIESNKSNKKIFLTPIAEFIFDRYNKYIQLGKPDDTTVIVSVVKENKGNLYKKLKSSL